MDDDEELSRREKRRRKEFENILLSGDTEPQSLLKPSQNILQPRTNVFISFSANLPSTSAVLPPTSNRLVQSQVRKITRDCRAPSSPLRPVQFNITEKVGQSVSQLGMCCHSSQSIHHEEAFTFNNIKGLMEKPYKFKILENSAKFKNISASLQQDPLVEHTATEIDPCLFPVQRDIRCSDAFPSKTYNLIRLEDQHDQDDGTSLTTEGAAAPLEESGDDCSLYCGARISVQESLLSIMTFAQAENLTTASLGRLLRLIELHCPEKNKCFKSNHDLFKSLENMDSNFELSFYCATCWKPRKSKRDLCDKCKDPKRKNEYFVHFPLKAQIVKLFMRSSFVEAIKYKHQRKKLNPDNLEDIYDGEVYQEYEKCALKNPYDLTFTWYTDGIQPYECSPLSLDPIYYFVNELPPKERHKPENLIFGGLWCSRNKPHPNLFMIHTCNELLKLKKGIEIDVAGSGKQECVHVTLLCGKCDSPAKACCLNIKYHSGYYSCPYCYTAGENSKRTGMVTVFPFEEILVERTMDNYKTLIAASILEYKTTKDMDAACKGIKGPTVLSEVCFGNMFYSAAIDIMHCINMGLTKQLLSLWFSETYKDQPFSLFEHLAEVNELLMNLELPEFVQRLFVPVDKLHLWKASLLRNFFFYILLPVLQGFMSEPYFEHVMSLVDAVSKLNTNSVSQSDIISADLVLSNFVQQLQNLYGLRHMSHNVHLLRHLPKLVKLFGPAWVTTCFAAEDLNGKLVNLIHGSSAPLIEISNRLPFFQGLSLSVSSLPIGSLARSFCESLTQKWKRFHMNDSISDKTFSVGFNDSTIKYREEVLELLSVLSPGESHITTFSKLYKDNQLFVATSYKRSLRVSSHVKYISSDGPVYGEILTFAKVVNKSSGNNSFFVYIKRFDVQSFCVDIPNRLQHIQRCVGSSTCDLIPIRCLQSVCFKISVHDKLFVSVPLNSMESE